MAIILTCKFQSFLIIEKNFLNQQSHSEDTVRKPKAQSVLFLIKPIFETKNMQFKLNHLKLPFIEVKVVESR